MKFELICFCLYLPLPKCFWQQVSLCQKRPGDVVRRDIYPLVIDSCINFQESGKQLPKNLFPSLLINIAFQQACGVTER